MRPKLLRFFEHEPVVYQRSYPLIGSEEVFLFTAPYQKALADLHTSTAGRYYELRNGGIKFCEQVGALQIGDLVIEVLPKMDREVTNKTLWHRVLLDMLKACGRLDLSSNHLANLDLRKNTLPELYFERYITELEELLRQGLVRKYRNEESNVNALKGKLNFAKHLNYNIVHPARFYTRHTIYDRNHLLHQVLRQALLVVAQNNRSFYLRDRVNRLLLEWPEGRPAKIEASLFDRLVLDRKTADYAAAISIARLLLLNYHPDIKAGGQQVLTLMFDMNALWEEFIYRRLKTAAAANNWQLLDQKKHSYWSNDSSYKLLIPDLLLIHRESGKRIVLDTKWKRPQQQKPDDHDLRQLLAYQLYFKADHAYLLYPGRTWANAPGQFHTDVFRSNYKLFQDVQPKAGFLFTTVLNEDRLIDRTNFLETELVNLLKKQLA